MENKESEIRYSRQIAVEEIGEDGQRALRDARVFIVGCGALGSMVAMQLAGAGIGHMTIADFDTVDISNLQRQFFFKTADAGKSKARMLFEAIAGLNPDVDVRVEESLITVESAPGLFSDYDFIVDATDNVCSKSMVEDVCQKISLPCCIAGVSGFRGQVMTVTPGDGKFAEIFPDAPDNGIAPCSIGGVMGPAAALCASIQASEVIKYLTGAGRTLSGRLLTFDLLTDTFQTYTVV